jgi:hypothetical protein
MSFDLSNDNRGCGGYIATIYMGLSWSAPFLRKKQKVKEYLDNL